MAESRTTHFSFNAEELSSLKQNTDAREVLKVLGYLSTWNLTFPTCRIYIDDDRTSLTATYHNDRDHLEYVIGAVWGGECFTTHS